MHAWIFSTVICSHLTWYFKIGVSGSSFCRMRLWKCVDTKILGHLSLSASQCFNVAHRRDRPSTWKMSPNISFKIYNMKTIRLQRCAQEKQTIHLKMRFGYCYSCHGGQWPRDMHITYLWNNRRDSKLKLLRSPNIDFIISKLYMYANIP